MLKNPKTRWKAIGLLLLVSLNIIPGVAPAVPPSAQNIVYVDNVQGNDANPGTASAPKATIQAGEDTAEALYGQDGTVVVWGGGPAYEEGVAVTSSMKFHGNGLGLEGFGGNRPPPVLSGIFYASDLGAVTLQGFELIGAGTEVVILQNIGEAACSDNHIHGVSFIGISLGTMGTSTSSARLENNHITVDSGSGVQVQSNETSQLTLHASENAVDGAAGTVAFNLLSLDSSELNVTADGNHVDGGPTGLWAISHHDTKLKVKADKNEFLGVGYVAVHFESWEGSHQTAEVTGNVTETGLFGGSIDTGSYGESTLELVAKNNRAIGEIVGGIAFLAESESELNALVEGNRVGSVFGGANTNAVVNLTVHGNDIEGDDSLGNVGAGAQAIHNSVIRAAFTNNRISGIQGDGIFLQDFGTATVTVTELDQNQITGSALNGIFVDLGNPASSVNGTKNNVVHDSGGNSLEVVNEPVNGQIKLNGETVSPLVDTP